MRIDHGIYGAANLDVAAARVEACLGLMAVVGGRHQGLGTDSRIGRATGWGGAELPVRVVEGDAGVRAIGIEERELRTG
jgi:hypothetical protein